MPIYYHKLSTLLYLLTFVSYWSWCPVQPRVGLLQFQNGVKNETDNMLIYLIINPQNNFAPMGSNPSTSISQISQFTYRPNKQWCTENISLKIAFFDYGVCASPFEYETQDDEGNRSPQLVELEKIFLEEYEKELKVPFDKNIKWNIGKLDAYLKRGRYSPLYYDNIGVINNKFFMERTQFQRIWEQAFNKAIINFLTEDQLKNEEIIQQKCKLLQMDWIHFRTLVVYAYRDQKLSFDQIVANKVATKYLLYMRDKFQSKVINEKYKIEKLVRRLYKFEVDIFFLQDIDRKILTYIEKKLKSFRIVRCQLSKSAILLSEKAIGKIVGDSIRPLHHYNRKYLDSNLVYQLSSQFESSPETIDYGNSFEQRQHRNFQFASPLKKKKTDLQSKNSIIEVKANVESPLKKQAAPKTANQQQNQLLLQSSIQKKEESEATSPVAKKKNEKEEEINTYLPPQVFKGLFWNDSTIVQFLSDIILITSCIDVQTYPEQEKCMLDSLSSLRETFPQHTIIVAININKEIFSIPGFEIYPNLTEKKVPTVYKRKTLIQSKVHKANNLMNSTEDYLFSTVPLKQAQVIDINYNEMGQNPRLTPNENHPYDHYLISGIVNCEVRKKVLKQN